jgi:DNA-binding response OmpR family regulator
MQVKPIKILLIEDSIEDTIIIREMLNETSKIHFELKNVSRLKTGFEELFQESFDILLLDLNLPDSWGFDTFIRTYDQAPELPIVILSGFDDEDIAVKAVREGAQDYLIKGEIDGRLLARSIYYAIERKKIERELMKTQKDLRKLIEWHEEELKETGKKLISEKKVGELLENKLRNVDDELKLEKFKLNTLINKLPVGILIVDASSGEPLIKNRKLEEIWGDCTETEELAEYCYYNGSHPDGNPYELNDWPLTRSITQGEEVKDQKIVVSKDDGSKSIISNSSIPIRNKNGQIIMGMSIFSDITDSELNEN